MKVGADSLKKTIGDGLSGSFRFSFPAYRTGKFSSLNSQVGAGRGALVFAVQDDAPEVRRSAAVAEPSAASTGFSRRERARRAWEGGGAWMFYQHSRL